METIEQTCVSCQGSGHDIGGWTYEAAREQPEKFNAFINAPGCVSLMPSVVSPIPFDNYGPLKCRVCGGSGNSKEYDNQLREEAAQQQKEQDEKDTAECLKKYSHLAKNSTNYRSHTLAAKNIRTELKAAFPGQKFSVRSSSFSMGNSVDIGWTDGPTAEEVGAITNKYQYGHFNGMEDIYESSRDVFNDLYGGTKYISNNRHWSNSFEVELKEKLTRYEGEDDYSFQRRVYSLANKTSRYVKPEATTKATTPVKETEVSFNDEKGGIEIRFPGKPDDIVRDTLKKNKFRWSRRLSLWYAKRTSDTEKAANWIQEYCAG